MTPRSLMVQSWITVLALGWSEWAQALREHFLRLLAFPCQWKRDAERAAGPFVLLAVAATAACSPTREVERLDPDQLRSGESYRLDGGTFGAAQVEDIRKFCDSDDQHRSDLGGRVVFVEAGESLRFIEMQGEFVKVQMQSGPHEGRELFLAVPFNRFRSTDASAR